MIAAIGICLILALAIAAIGLVDIIKPSGRAYYKFGLLMLFVTIGVVFRNEALAIGVMMGVAIVTARVGWWLLSTGPAVTLRLDEADGLRVPTIALIPYTCPDCPDSEFCVCPTCAGCGDKNVKLNKNDLCRKCRPKKTKKAKK